MIPLKAAGPDATRSETSMLRFVPLYTCSTPAPSLSLKSRYFIYLFNNSTIHVERNIKFE